MIIRHYLNNRRGQAIVETAVVLPIVVLLLFSIVEFGQILNQYLVLTAAAREGARTAAVSNDAAAQTAVTASVASIQNDGLAVSIIYPDGKREQGKAVTVTVSKPLQVTTPIIRELIEQAFAPDLPIITAQSVMRVEQP